MLVLSNTNNQCLHDFLFSESGVFAIPLSRAVSQNLPVGQSSQSPTANCKPGQTAKDETRKSQKLHGANETTTTPICNNNESPRTRRHSSTSSVSQVSSKSSSDINPKQTVASNQENEVTANGPPESPNWKSRLIDALTLLSSSASASCLIDREATLLTLPPQVPPIVLEAIEHLELYGKRHNVMIPFEKKILHQGFTMAVHTCLVDMVDTFPFNALSLRRWGGGVVATLPPPFQIFPCTILSFC